MAENLRTMKTARRPLLEHIRQPSGATAYALGLEKRVSAAERAPVRKAVVAPPVSKIALKKKIPPVTQRKVVGGGGGLGGGLYALGSYWTYSGAPDAAWHQKGTVSSGTKPVRANLGTYFMTDDGFSKATYPAEPPLTDRHSAPLGKGVFIADVPPETDEVRQVVLTQIGDPDADPPEALSVKIYLRTQVTPTTDSWSLLNTITDAEGLGIVSFKRAGHNIIGVSYIRSGVLRYDFSNDVEPALGVTWGDVDHQKMIVDNTGIVDGRQGYKLWYDPSSAKVYTAYNITVLPNSPTYTQSQQALNFGGGPVNVDVAISSGIGVMVLQLATSAVGFITSVTGDRAWTLLGSQTVADGTLYLYTANYVDADPGPVTVTIDGTSLARLDVYTFFDSLAIDSFDLFHGSSPLTGNQSGGAANSLSASLWSNGSWNQATGTLILNIDTTPHVPGEVVGGWVIPKSPAARPEFMETGDIPASWVWTWDNNTKVIVIPVLMITADPSLTATYYTRIARADGHAVDEGHQWETDIADSLGLPTYTVDVPGTDPLVYPPAVPLKDFVVRDNQFLIYQAGLTQPFIWSTNGSDWQTIASPESNTRDIAGIQMGTADSTGIFVLFDNGHTYYMDPATLEFTQLATLGTSLGPLLLFGIADVVEDV